jgi:threonine aldolase
LSASSIARAVKEREDIHAPKPRMISLSQATELGTVYTAEELHSVGQAARDLHLHFHIDGARFANAAAELEVAPRKLTWEAGVDALSFGGTKNGMGWGEALVFFNRDLARDFARRQKQAAQLASKMRFLAAPWIGLLRDGAWLRHATRANQIAHILEQKLRSIPSLRIAFPRQANSVFVDMPPALVQGLHQRGWHFYTDVGPGAARFMGSWDSTEEDVEHLVSDIQDLTRERCSAL